MMSGDINKHTLWVGQRLCLLSEKVIGEEKELELLETWTSPHIWTEYITDSVNSASGAVQTTTGFTLYKLVE